MRQSIKDETRDTLQRLIYNNSIRRTHQQVGMYLPPIFLTELLLEGDALELHKMLEAYPHLEQVIIDAIEQGDIGLLTAT